MSNFGDTPQFDAPDLCASCLNLHRVEGNSAMQVIKMCMNTHPALSVPFKVTRCSGYCERHRVPLHKMEEQAWILILTKTGRQFMGFRAPNRTQNVSIIGDEDV